MSAGAVVVLFATVISALPAQNAVPPQDTVQLPLPAGWRDAPEYVALFAPPRYRETYRAFVAPVDLEAAIRALTADPGIIAVQAPGSWQARGEYALDAFGTGGTYDRGKMARLYGSSRPTVARGPRGALGEVDEAWTLISPYPSPDLATLNAGTLFLVLRIP